ncbi:MAG: hypothetical protein ABSH38_09140 [Verrucomicrobiota bacterium]
MKAREMFALAIRILGLIGLAHVIHSVINDVYYESMNLFWQYYVIKLCYVLVGLYCLRGAPQVVDLAYPEEAKSPETKPAGN